MDLPNPTLRLWCIEANLVSREHQQFGWVEYTPNCCPFWDKVTTWSVFRFLICLTQIKSTTLLKFLFKKCISFPSSMESNQFGNLRATIPLVEVCYVKKMPFNSQIENASFLISLFVILTTYVGMRVYLWTSNSTLLWTLQIMDGLMLLELLMTLLSTQIPRIIPILNWWFKYQIFRLFTHPVC